MANKRTLHQAVEGGRLETVRAMVEEMQADVNETRSRDDRDTPLIIATRNSFYSIAEFLIQSGADVNAKDDEGETSLIIAIINDNLQLVQLLLNSGAKVNETNSSQDSVLHVFFYDQRVRNIDILNLLLDAGANKNAVDEKENTPLHVSFHGGDFVPYTQLLNNEVDNVYINLRNNEGETALHKKVKYSTVQDVQFFIGHGADVNTINNAGMSLLHSAATSEKTENEVVTTLSETLGINQRDPNGWTPLHWAVEKLHGEKLLERINLLFECGANANEIDNEGKSALKHFVNKTKETREEETPEQREVNDKIFSLFVERLE